MIIKKNIRGQSFTVGRTAFKAGFILLFFIYTSPVFAFQADSTASESISLSSWLDKTETPLNIPVMLTVTLTWEGRPDRYSITSFDAPVLTNLELSGSASSSRSEIRKGKIQTIKEFLYELKPRSPGMAYIDGLIISYTGAGSNVSDHLTTTRLSIEILPPEFETDYGKFLKVFIGVVVLGAFSGLLIWLRRKLRLRKKIDDTPLKPLEDTAIEQLAAVKNRMSGSSYRKPLDDVIGIFRRYIVEKFDIPVEKRSGAALTGSIYEAGIEDAVIQKIGSILDEAEQLRFSGADVTPDKFELLFGAVESCISLCREADSGNGAG